MVVLLAASDPPGSAYVIEVYHWMLGTSHVMSSVGAGGRSFPWTILEGTLHQPSTTLNNLGY